MASLAIQRRHVKTFFLFRSPANQNSSLAQFLCNRNLSRASFAAPKKNDLPWPRGRRSTLVKRARAKTRPPPQLTSLASTSSRLSHAGGESAIVYLALSKMSMRDTEAIRVKIEAWKRAASPDTRRIRMSSSLFLFFLGVFFCVFIVFRRRQTFFSFFLQSLSPPLLRRFEFR